MASPDTKTPSRRCANWALSEAVGLTAWTHHTRLRGAVKARP